MDTPDEVRTMCRNIELTHAEGRKHRLGRFHADVDALEHGSPAHTAGLDRLARLYTALREKELWPL